MRLFFLILTILFFSYTNAQQEKNNNKLVYDFLTFHSADSVIYLQKTTLPIDLKKSFEAYDKLLRSVIDSSLLREIIENQKKEIYSEWKEFKSSRIVLIKDEKMLIDKDSVRRTSYYVVSTPIYDNKKRYAILSFALGVSSTRLSGAYCLLKKEKHKWKVLSYFPL